MRYFYLTFFAVLLFAAVSAQTDSINYRSVYDSYKNFISDPALKNASIGICFKDVSSDKIILSEEIDKSLIPASTLKLFTTFTAFNLLGPDYRFRTLLQYDGNIDPSGTLHGNIYIFGGADPTFGSHRFGSKCLPDTIFYQFAKALKTAGIYQIDGSVIADGSAFGYDMVPYSWSWADVGNYYGCGAVGMNICENEYTLTVYPADSVDKKAVLGKMDPFIPDLKLVNYVTTAKNGGAYDIYILGTQYDDIRRVEGAIAVGNKDEKIRGSVPDPEYFTAQLFNDYLIRNNIPITSKPLCSRQLYEQNISLNNWRTLIYTYESPALSEIIRLLNTYSINLYAESIIKALGKQKFNNGSYSSGVRAVKEFLNSCKIDLKGFNMFDGSGMTRANTVTARQMSDLLTLIYKSKYYSTFTNTLPLSGSPGTLSKFGSGTILDGNLKAKTGTMFAVKAYSGFLKNRSDKTFSVVVIANNYTCTTSQLQEKITGLFVKLAESR